MYKLFAKIKNLPHLSAVDHYLVEVTHNLRAFYHLLKSMALPTHLFIHTSRYAQVGLNYILSYCFFFFKIVSLKILYMYQKRHVICTKLKEQF